ncbi:hypothetical protein JKP88DRAFT_253247 [Tribonema minus]|uniref:C3H1-type domain-containing protein n=1 Tax=Tribonema minus TaxID=303371 RepID=A0A836CJV9_9STRA|nr:hypothetical protein JKP88DRAFT_253247 [Tribonema minus]
MSAAAVHAIIRSQQRPDISDEAFITPPRRHGGPRMHPGTVTATTACIWQLLLGGHMAVPPLANDTAVFYTALMYRRRFLRLSMVPLPPPQRQAIHNWQYGAPRGYGSAGLALTHLLLTASTAHTTSTPAAQNGAHPPAVQWSADDVAAPHLLRSALAILRQIFIGLREMAGAASPGDPFTPIDLDSTSRLTFLDATIASMEPLQEVAQGFSASQAHGGADSSTSIYVIKSVVDHYFEQAVRSADLMRSQAAAAITAAAATNKRPGPGARASGEDRGSRARLSPPSAASGGGGSNGGGSSGNGGGTGTGEPSGNYLRARRVCLSFYAGDGCNSLRDSCPYVHVRRGQHLPPATASAARGGGGGGGAAAAATGAGAAAQAAGGGDLARQPTQRSALQRNAATWQAGAAAGQPPHE